VQKMAAEISPDLMPAPGDHLELALAKAGDLLAKQETHGSILVVADSVDGDLGAVTQAYQKHGAPSVVFLAVNELDSSEDEALRKAAHALKAKVVPLTTDGTDIEAVVRTASRPPVSRSALQEKAARWAGRRLVSVAAAGVVGGIGLSSRNDESEGGSRVKNSDTSRSATLMAGKTRPRPSFSSSSSKCGYEDQGRAQGRERAGGRGRAGVGGRQKMEVAG
jgi:hypothetical protein